MSRRRLPPLNWLKTFESAARLLSFSKAATELHLTQAAVSQHIKGLESQLDTQLFTRLPRGLELTIPGKAYLPAVNEAIEKLSAATSELFDNTQKEIVICVNIAYFIHVLAPKLSQFTEQYPNIKLKFSSHIWLAEANKNADFIISYGSHFKENNRTYRLTVDKLLPVCSPKLLNGKKTPTTVEEINDHTLIHVVGYKEGWSFYCDQLNQLEIKPQNELEFDTLTTTLEMAVQGAGIALGRCSLVKHLIEEGKLISPINMTVKTDEAFSLIDNRKDTTQEFKNYFKHWLLDLSMEYI
ncbi:LysR family transcriptional regulator [Photobacterium leiognathi]|uniref:LysR family transcriptional regulator n=1 Tax=Photobacterium leiognathi TaxID=553611 RepID=UPI000D160B53|nr:LysR family transcriptional regulator [Photobacterium leiognathi]PSW43241.1 LysR family transcriptional regulator [Photobacterium leiognathi subsp. mandapamensis]